MQIRLIGLLVITCVSGFIALAYSILIFENMFTLTFIYFLSHF